MTLEAIQLFYSKVPYLTGKGTSSFYTSAKETCKLSDWTPILKVGYDVR